MGGLTEYLFAYGSLAGELAGVPGRLRGYRRRLGVAADNSIEIPGYKRYLDPADGSAPAVFVAFADLVEDEDTIVNGVLAPLPPTDLVALDLRERSYDRIDVTADADPAPGTVWAYIGSPAGRARLQQGEAAGAAVVTRAYLDGIHAAFRALGAEEYDEFLASSDLDGLPIRDLDRVDLP